MNNSTLKILWLAFPEDSLSGRRFDAPAQARLAQVFDVADAASPWRRALKILKMPPPPPDVDMIGWRAGVPYINGSALAMIITDGTAVAVPDPARGYRFVTPRKLLSLPRVMGQQWRVTRFVQDRLRKLSEPDRDPLVESLALGLAVQVLLMRLDAAAMMKMPQYLINPNAAPMMHRQTFSWLQELQMRRTALSPAWHQLFLDVPKTDAASTPPFFWDDDAVMLTSPAAPSADHGGIYHGQPVFAGRAHGFAEVITRAEDNPAPRGERAIFVFRHARPETTVYFSQAAAVVYAHGGVLSHACVVARDMGVPCVTGLGDEFYEHVTAPDKQPVMLSVDAASGNVKITSR